MNLEEPGTIGLRIRNARRERGLSVKELADMAGCLDEYLDWVEDGQVEPPVALLLQLAKAMKLAPGTFMESYHSQVKRLEEASKRTKHYSYQTLTPPEADKHLMAFSIKIPPNTAHEGVGYRHEGEEFIYVLSGEVEVLLGQTTKRLTEKESLRFNANLDHYLSNPINRVAELLVILYIP